MTIQYIKNKKKIDNNIKDVLKKGQFILGNEVEKLEEKLSSYSNVKHCITNANGTDSLLMALMAIGISKGDEVITTPFSWISTAETIKFLGAKPIYVDINEIFLIDYKKIENYITKKTKAILPVSLFGQMPELIKIKKIANKYGLYVIEDAAQSFGATHYDKKSCSISDISCTSFFPTKPLGCYGDGGACFTNNDDIAKKIRSIRNHGKDINNSFVEIGLNSRLDTIQAAILNAKLSFFKKELKLRQKVADRYNNLLSEYENLIKTPKILKHNKSVYAQYTITTNYRDKITLGLKKNNIPFSIYYKKLIPENKAYKYKINNLQIANKIKHKVLSLPFHPYLSLKEQKKIVNTIIKNFND